MSIPLTNMTSITQLKQEAREIRRQVLKMIVSARASHIASSFSIVELLVYLYEQVLQVDPSFKPERDRFILSKGWGVSTLYAILARKGFFKKNLLDTYCKDGSKFIGATTRDVPGIEVRTCSMGHGLPIGVGMALATRLLKNPGRIFVLLSDGECDEGSTWEAILQAGHHKLDNLIAIIDYNKLQSFGLVKDILDLEPLAEKWKAFRWAIQSIDGHNFQDMRCAFARLEKGKPNVIIAHTIKGMGVSAFEGNNEWHYRTPTKTEIRIAQKEL